MVFRFGILPLVLFVAAVAWASGAAAQSSGTGTLVGRVLFCRMLPRPVEAPDGDLPPLADVTPGGNRRFPPPVPQPVPNLQLMVQGTNARAVTGADGGFTLSGVPASQPLVLVAQPSPGPVLVLNAPSLSVAPGQVLDLGTIGMGACADGGSLLVPQPPAATAETPDADVNAAPPPADADNAAAPDDTAPTDDTTD